MTPGFQNLPVQAESFDGLNWVLTKTLEYFTRSGVLYRVIIGATTDGVSDPIILQLFRKCTGKPFPCGVLHDGGYRDKLEFLCHDGQWRAIAITEQMADDLFLEALEVHGAGEFDARAFYEAVKEFGRKAFVADRPPGDVQANAV